MAVEGGRGKLAGHGGGRPRGDGGRHGSWQAWWRFESGGKKWRGEAAVDTVREEEENEEKGGGHELG